MARYFLFHNRHDTPDCAIIASITDPRVEVVDVYANSAPDWGPCPGIRITLFPTVIVTDGTSELARLEGESVTDAAVLLLGFDDIPYVQSLTDAQLIFSALAELQTAMAAAIVWTPEYPITEEKMKSGDIGEMDEIKKKAPKGKGV